MRERRSLLLSTYGGEVREVVSGLRTLPHDRLIVISEREQADDGHLSSLLDRLGVNHSIMRVDPADLMGTAMVISMVMQEFRRKGWQTLLDITGGRKLLSDAAMLAALSTGTEICCFEVEPRRFPMLTGMGVSEALPPDVAQALRTFKWPLPLGSVKGLEAKDPTGRLLRRMKDMELVRLMGSGDEAVISLTERGRACQDWVARMQDQITVSWV